MHIDGFDASLQTAALFTLFITSCLVLQTSVIPRGNSPHSVEQFALSLEKLLANMHGNFIMQVMISHH